MSENSWYTEWFNSPFYHKLYFERDDKEASDFIRKIISHLNAPPGSRMLDVACGRGRHSKILAAMGYIVTGIDISPDSIIEAKQWETPDLDFFMHDMRLPFWGNYFDFAFNLFTSFGYFKTRREHDDAIRTISRSLKPGATIVIDYLNVHYSENTINHNENKTIGNTNFRILRWHDDVHFFKKIVVEDPSLQEALVFTEKVAKFTLGDFTDMLAYQDMQVTEVFGDYDLKKYDVNKTPRLIILAKKKQAPPSDKEKRLYSDGRKTDALT